MGRIAPPLNVTHNNQGVGTERVNMLDTNYLDAYKLTYYDNLYTKFSQILDSWHCFSSNQGLEGTSKVTLFFIFDYTLFAFYFLVQE